MALIDSIKKVMGINLSREEQIELYGEDAVQEAEEQEQFIRMQEFMENPKNEQEVLAMLEESRLQDEIEREEAKYYEEMEAEQKKQEMTEILDEIASFQQPDDDEYEGVIIEENHENIQEAISKEQEENIQTQEGTKETEQMQENTQENQKVQDNAKDNGQIQNQTIIQEPTQKQNTQDNTQEVPKQDNTQSQGNTKEAINEAQEQQPQTESQSQAQSQPKQQEQNQEQLDEEHIELPTNEVKLNNLDYLKEEKIKAKTLFEKDSKAENTRDEFSQNFKEIEQVVQLSNKIDGMEEDLEKEKAKNQKGLEKKEQDIKKEVENLDRAFDNLMKVTDISELLRALYILDKALYEIGEKNKEESPMIKVLKQAVEKGETLTKELAIDALKSIKESYNKLDSFQNTRKLEMEYKTKLDEDMTKSKLTASPQTKEQIKKRIKENMEYIEKELPSFKRHYPKMVQDARDIINNQNTKEQKQRIL